MWVSCQLTIYVQGDHIPCTCIWSPLCDLLRLTVRCVCSGHTDIVTYSKILSITLVISISNISRVPISLQINVLKSLPLLPFYMYICMYQYTLYDMYICTSMCLRITLYGFHVALNFPPRIVKLTSPNLNYLVLLGAFLMYTSVYFYVLPSTKEFTSTLYCHVSNFCFALLATDCIDVK